MEKYFTADSLSISLEFRSMPDQAILRIASDYSGSSHKSQLHVSENYLKTDLETFWGKMKKATGAVLGMTASFDEIDHYDSVTNIYYTPIAYVHRPARVPKLKQREHGVIPKDWEFILSSQFKLISKAEPFMKIIEPAVGKFLDDTDRKRIRKGILDSLKTKHVYSFYK